MSKLTKYERKAAIAKPESELDKIKQWFWQAETKMLPHDKPIVLTPSQIRRKDKLFAIWSWLITKSDQSVIQAIMKEYGVEQRMAYMLVNDAKELFGDIKKSTREAQKALRIAQREKEIEKINDDENLESKDKYDLIHKNRERIEKMEGLDKEDTLSLEQVIELLTLPDTTFTTNPEVLTLDIDHEDVSEENLD